MTGEERLSILLKIMELRGKHIPVPCTNQKGLRDHMVANFYLRWGLAPDLFHPPAPEEVSVEWKKQGAKNIVLVKGEYDTGSITYDSHSRSWLGDRKKVCQMIDKIIFQSRWEVNPS